MVPGGAPCGAPCVGCSRAGQQLRCVIKLGAATPRPCRMLQQLLVHRAGGYDSYRPRSFVLSQDDEVSALPCHGHAGSGEDALDAARRESIARALLQVLGGGAQGNALPFEFVAGVSLPTGPRVECAPVPPLGMSLPVFMSPLVARATRTGPKGKEKVAARGLARGRPSATRARDTEYAEEGVPSVPVVPLAALATFPIGAFGAYGQATPRELSDPRVPGDGAQVLVRHVSSQATQTDSHEGSDVRGGKVPGAWDAGTGTSDSGLGPYKRPSRPAGEMPSSRQQSPRPSGRSRRQGYDAAVPRSWNPAAPRLGAEGVGPGARLHDHIISRVECAGEVTHQEHDSRHDRSSMLLTASDLMVWSASVDKEDGTGRGGVGDKPERWQAVAHAQPYGEDDAGMGAKIGQFSSVAASPTTPVHGLGREPGARPGIRGGAMRQGSQVSQVSTAWASEGGSTRDGSEAGGELRATKAGGGVHGAKNGPGVAEQEEADRSTLWTRRMGTGRPSVERSQVQPAMSEEPSAGSLSMLVPVVDAREEASTGSVASELAHLQRSRIGDRDTSPDLSSSSSRGEAEDGEDYEADAFEEYSGVLTSTLGSMRSARRGSAGPQSALPSPDRHAVDEAEVAWTPLDADRGLRSHSTTLVASHSIVQEELDAFELASVESGELAASLGSAALSPSRPAARRVPSKTRAQQSPSQMVESAAGPSVAVPRVTSGAPTRGPFVRSVRGPTPPQPIGAVVDAEPAPVHTQVNVSSGMSGRTISLARGRGGMASTFGFKRRPGA